MAQGLGVSMPLLDSSPYDCIIDNGQRLLKIQVKGILNRAKKSRKNGYKINLRGGTNYYKKNEVDFFAIYHLKLNGFFIIPNLQQKSLVINIKGKYKDNFNNFALFY